jgi:hypothetical protein
MNNDLYGHPDQLVVLEQDILDVRTASSGMDPQMATGPEGVVSEGDPSCTARFPEWLYVDNRAADLANVGVLDEDIFKARNRDSLASTTFEVGVPYDCVTSPAARTGPKIQKISIGVCDGNVFQGDTLGSAHIEAVLTLQVRDIGPFRTSGVRVRTPNAEIANHDIAAIANLHMRSLPWPEMPNVSRWHDAAPIRGSENPGAISLNREV